MNRLFFVALLAFVLIAGPARSQTLFVDAVKGNDNAKGTVTEPLRSLERAVTITNTFNGDEPVTIRLAPGLYLLNQQAIIPSFKKQTDTVKYTIEAMVMPDDDNW